MYNRCREMGSTLSLWTRFTLPLPWNRRPPSRPIWSRLESCLCPQDYAARLDLLSRLCFCRSRELLRPQGCRHPVRHASPTAERAFSLENGCAGTVLLVTQGLFFVRPFQEVSTLRLCGGQGELAANGKPKMLCEILSFQQFPSVHSSAVS